MVRSLNSFCLFHRSMIKYAFVKAGYMDKNEDLSWQTPSEFSLEQPDTCIECAEQSLFRCTWCKNHYCITHGFVEIHVCETYVE